MKIKAIKELIKDMPDDFDVYLENADGSVSDFQVEPITVSCDDNTVQGYIVVPKEVKH